MVLASFCDTSTRNWYQGAFNHINELQKKKKTPLPPYCAQRFQFWALSPAALMSRSTGQATHQWDTFPAYVSFLPCLIRPGQPTDSLLILKISSAVNPSIYKLSMGPRVWMSLCVCAALSACWLWTLHHEFLRKYVFTCGNKKRITRLTNNSIIAMTTVSPSVASTDDPLLQRYQTDAIQPGEDTAERKLLAKIDFRLIPVLTILFILAFLDRFVEGIYLPTLKTRADPLGIQRKYLQCSNIRSTRGSQSRRCRIQHGTDDILHSIYP